MTVPVVASWTENDSVGSVVASITLTKPTGATINNNDLLIILAGNNDSTDTAQWDDSSNKPTGFTLIKTFGNASKDVHVAAFARVADTTEGATITLPQVTSRILWGAYIHITGADISAAMHKVGADSEVFGASLEITGVITTIDDCLCFYLYGLDGGSGAPFSVAGAGWSETSENQQSGMGNTFGTRSLASLGASGSATVSQSGVSDGQVGFQFAIAPLAASGPSAHQMQAYQGMERMNGGFRR